MTVTPREIDGTPIGRWNRTKYSYDADGNRLTKTVGGSPTAYTYQAGSNRLATVGGSAVTLDAEGRTTATGTHSYAYNASGRLQTVSQGSTELGRYGYDAFGLRRTKLAGGSTTVFHYDESGNLLAETTAAGETLRAHVWAGGTPIAQVASGILTYLHADHLNTPRWGTSSSGALVWRWRSDGFGQALPEEDVDGNGTAVTVNLRLPGQVYDAESGLHYNRARYYDPATGRYLETDPIGQLGGTNVYAYALAQPTMLIDPDGLTPIYNLPTSPHDLDPLDILLDPLSKDCEKDKISAADQALLEGAKDGDLTLDEANAWWRHANGADLVVDASRLTVYTRNGKNATVIGDDYFVHGQVTLNPETGEIKPGNYDFERHDPSGWWDVLTRVRNLGTRVGAWRAGEGTPYTILYSGQPTIIRPPPQSPRNTGR